MSTAETILSAIRSRRSIRRFLDKPVERDVLAQLIEAASWAPSASNRQDWLFHVVTSREIKHAMSEAVRARWEKLVAENGAVPYIRDLAAYVQRFTQFESAPAVIVFSSWRLDRTKNEVFGEAAAACIGSATSAAMAAQTLMLAAHAMGLGSCCLTGPVPARDELAKIIKLGAAHEILCLIAVGWPAGTPPPPPRRPVEKIARFLA